MSTQRRSKKQETTYTLTESQLQQLINDAIASATSTSKSVKGRKKSQATTEEKVSIYKAVETHKKDGETWYCVEGHTKKYDTWGDAHEVAKKNWKKANGISEKDAKAWGAEKKAQRTHAWNCHLAYEAVKEELGKKRVSKNKWNELYNAKLAELEA